MIPTVEPLQKQGEEILPLASVDSQRQESYVGKKRDFSRWTIDGGTVVGLTLTFSQNPSWGFPRFLKRSPKKRETDFGRGRPPEVLSPAHFVHYLPPHSAPPAQLLAASAFFRGDFGDAVAWGHNLPMPLHRANFALGFFLPQTRAYSHAPRTINNPFPSRPRLPIPRPPILTIPPLSPCVPPPNNLSNARGGARRDARSNESRWIIFLDDPIYLVKIPVR